MSYICNDNVPIYSLARANKRLIGSRGDLPDPIIATPAYAQAKIYNKLNKKTNGYNGILAGQARCGPEQTESGDWIITEWGCRGAPAPVGGGLADIERGDEELRRFDDKPWLYDVPVSRRGAEVLEPPCLEGQPQAYLDSKTGEIVFHPTRSICTADPPDAILVREQPTRNKVDLCGPRAYGQESLACWKKQVEQDWIDCSIDVREDLEYSTMCRRAHEAAERHRFPKHTYATRGAF